MTVTGTLLSILTGGALVGLNHETGAFIAGIALANSPLSRYLSENLKFFYKASIDIRTLGLMEGKLPAKVMSLVVEWAQEHQDELLENWSSIKETGEFHKIKPLV
ncbi:MAG TPA: DUF4160 domain-containing protein [Chlorobaculum parvum]|uniref:DUF4160 domain-containing protein n=1 Tax=Chlorobaculum parvum TaxID=274539 RepID=A0A7C5DI13_9CHLB|nr:DUF4160 domain-containing protein [Chlorobaculum parvum]